MNNPEPSNYNQVITSFYGCAPMPRRNFLLDDNVETQGGDAAVTQAPIITPVEQAGSSDNQARLSVDWDALAKAGNTEKKPGEEGYRAPETALEREKRELDETTKKGEQENKAALQEGEKVQVDDKGEGRQQQSEQSQRQEEQRQEQVDEILQAYPEAAPFLKKMSKEAVQYVRARLNDSIQQKRELEETRTALTTAQSGRSVIPQSLYENPQGFVLIPEHQQATQAVNYAAKIVNHWQVQRAKILAGEEWFDMDDKGNVVPTPQKATAQAQAMVDGYWMDTKEQLRNIVQYKQNIEQQFQQKSGVVKTTAAQIEKELFPPEKWEDKTKPEYRVVENVKAGLKNTGIIDSNHPAFSIFAKTAAQVLMLRDLVATLQSKNGKANAIAADTKKAGPSGNGTGGAGSTSTSGGEDVMAEFSRLKHGNPAWGKK